MARTGRRPGPGRTREKILAAARSQFAKSGFESTTIRGIAAGAHVDPKLVLHYFESKEGIFQAAMDFPFDPAQAIPELLRPGLDGLGVRLARFFIDIWDSPAGVPAHAILRSMVTNASAPAPMRDVVSRENPARAAPALQLDHPQVRARLAASQLIRPALL